jgi:heterodisulfide reductase subunit A-like polyferredoxin
MLRIFCKHEWKLLSETVTKSDLETLLEAFSDRHGKVNTHADSGNRKHIAICTCTKCGKLERFVEYL